MSKAGRKFYEEQVNYWTILMKRAVMLGFQADRRKPYSILKGFGLETLSMRRNEFFNGETLRRQLTTEMIAAIRMSSVKQRERLSKKKIKSFDIDSLLGDFIQNYFIAVVVKAIIERFKKRYYLWIDDAIARGIDRETAQVEFRKLGLQDKIIAANIARVESARAVNVGQRFAAQTFQYKLQKQWISVGDIRTRGLEAKDRSDHWDLSGEIVPEDMPFRDPRSGSLMLHPMDMSMGAKLHDVINCRCHVEYEIVYDTFGNPIPK